jgi:hypothetical protein
MTAQFTGKILVVDDDQRMLDMIGDFLGPEGHVLTFARSGEEALEKLDGSWPDAILTDVPQCRGEDEQIPSHRPIIVHFVLDHQRYAFDTVIEEVGVKVRLHERHHDVHGVAFRRPSTVKPIQRRAHYRVPLFGSDPIDVQLVHAHPKIHEACLIDGQAGTGQMLNLSAGGTAILVSASMLHNPRPGQYFYLTFPLPTVKEELCMLGVVTYVSPVPSSHPLRIGMAFINWAGQDFDRCCQEITRSITQLERQMLRRKRKTR